MGTWKRRLAVGTGAILALGVAVCGGSGLVGMALPAEVAVQEVGELSASPDAIFDLLDDPEGLATWWDVAMAKYAQEHGSEMGMTVEHVPGTPDSGPGCKVDFKAGGMTAETWEYLSLEPAKRAVYEVDFKIFRVERTLTLEPLDGGGTRMTWAEAGTVGNPWLRLMMSAMGTEDAKQNFRGAMEALDAAASTRVP